MSHRASYQLKSSSKSRPLSRRSFREDDDDEDEYEEEDIDLGKSDEDEDDEDYTGYQRAVEANYRIRNPKRQRVEDFNNAATYEFRPRNVNSGRVLQPEWNDHSTQVLLETWGDRFLQLGRSSLRGDDWCEVSERVSETTGFNFGVSDCRSRLNVLKSKYKREKSKVESLGGGGSISKWAYFKKMDVLMTMPPRQQQQCGLACGVDSGEFVFMNPKVYLDHSNALDEMRDSPGNSESEDGDEDGGEEDERKRDEEEEDEIRDMESYKMLSDSIKRVGEIYEKIENSKRQHMMELEGMRMEFQRDLELQKKEMIERTRVEIARLREDGEEDDDEEEDGDCSTDSASE